MSRRRRLRDAPAELALRLDSLAELFAPPRLDEHGGTANLESGVERLVTQLRSLPLEHRPRVVPLVPSRELGDDSEARVRDSILRYCKERSEHLRHARAAQVRDGIDALWIGLPILFGGLVLIETVRRIGLPTIFSGFLADGLILVLAWVAVWYPLDTLLYYGRSTLQERRAVERLAELPFTVRADNRAVADE